MENELCCLIKKKCSKKKCKDVCGDRDSLCYEKSHKRCVDFCNCHKERTCRTCFEADKECCEHTKKCDCCGEKTDVDCNGRHNF